MDMTENVLALQIVRQVPIVQDVDIAGLVEPAGFVEEVYQEEVSLVQDIRSLKKQKTQILNHIQILNLLLQNRIHHLMSKFYPMIIFF